MADWFDVVREMEHQCELNELREQVVTVIAQRDELARHLEARTNQLRVEVGDVAVDLPAAPTAGEPVLI